MTAVALRRTTWSHPEAGAAGVAALAWLAVVAPVAGPVVYGGRCIAGCWAIMLAMAVTTHTGVGLMVLLTAIATAERLLARPARHATALAAVLAFAALVSLAA